MNCKKIQELAAAKAVGALDRADAARLEAACTENSGAREECASFQEAAAALAAALVTPVPPPASLKAKILAQASQSPRPTPTVPASAANPHLDAGSGFRFVIQSETEWQPGPLPGIRIKTLSHSQDMGYHVILAELAPGTRFPEHDHHSSEELFVLSGNLRTEGRLLGPGDFLHAEPGTHHGELVSPDGCVALLIEKAPMLPVS